MKSADVGCKVRVLCHLLYTCLSGEKLETYKGTVLLQEDSEFDVNDYRKTVNLMAS